MSNENREEAIFDRAIQIDSTTERSKVVDLACKGDRRLRDRVEALLKVHYEAFGFMTKEPDDIHSPLVESLEGSLLGPYRLGRQIGEGGLGVVYLAEQQEPVRRQVALKVIKPGMDTKQVIARFQAERQALAMMHHPNIAMVLDVGATEAGRPYFVMEYIPGVSLTDYCDRHELNLQERLTLFIDVCQGVQHAHSKGIIHRDLKPSNILVSTVDEQPLAKIIDFGVAKAIEQRLTERTIYTELGRVIGTPAYMSPEQAEMRGETVDHRTDIYSLGVLLYELLVGQLPLDLDVRTVAFDEIARRIREENPQTPSTRFGRLNQEGKTTMAAQRGAKATNLLNALRGDLDWICLKAMEKEPSRRYASPADLAKDIQSYFTHEPVRARPPSLIYRCRKYVRKNRGSVMAVAGIFGALTIGLAASLLGLQEARWQTYLANVQAATSSIEDGNMVEAFGCLEACSEKYRNNWEYRHLRLASDLSVRQLPHPDGINSVAFSPDGEHLVTGSWDGVVRLWDLAANRPPLELRGPEASVQSVAFSPDGRTIAAAPSGETVRLWDARTGLVWKTFQGHEGQVKCVAFSPDGKYLASGSVDRTVRVWNVGTGGYLEILEGHNEEVSSLAFHPAGIRLASGSWDKTIRLWNCENWELVKELKDHQQGVVSVTFSKDGQYLASGSHDNTVRLWDGETGDFIKVWLLPQYGDYLFPGGEKAIDSVAFSPDGRHLAVGAKDNTIRVWDVAQAHLVTTLYGHKGAVWSVAYSPDGKWIASGGADAEVRLWDVKTREASTALCAHENGLDAFTVSADGTFMASAFGPSIRLWKAETGAFVSELLGHEGTVRSLAFSPDGSRLVSGATDYQVRLWDLTSGELLHELPHEDELRCVAFSPDGKTIASGGVEKILRLWNAETGKLIHELRGHTGVVFCLAFSPDGQFIATGPSRFSLGDKIIRLWNVAKGELIALLAGHRQNVYCLQFSPDGELLASASYDRTIRLWDVTTPTKPHLVGEELEGFASVLTLAFSDDGNRLISGSDSGVSIWDVSRNKLITTLRGHQNQVKTVAFGPNDNRIFSGSSDGIIRIWESELASARTMWQAEYRRDQ